MLKFDDGMTVHASAAKMNRLLELAESIGYYRGYFAGRLPGKSIDPTHVKEEEVSYDYGALLTEIHIDSFAHERGVNDM